MALKKPGRLQKLLARRMARHWRRAARDAGAAPLSIVRRQRGEARNLRAHLDRLIAVADERLSLPMPGNTAFARPNGTDWAWRPDIFRSPVAQKGIAGVENRQGFGTGVTVFHDCAQSEITLRQIRNLREEDLAAYGLRMDVMHFDGSFLSLVLDLPPEAAAGLKKRHIVRLDALVEVERPLQIFARLNVQHGPNTEQQVRELPLQGGASSAEFDLAYTELNEKRAERMWLEFIFEQPAMNQVTVRDLTLCRFPRAEL